MTSYSTSTGIQKQSKKGQIVCMSSTHWHFLWQRPQQIMFRLSQNYNVLFVDPPYPMPMKEILNELDPKKANIHNKIKTISNSLKVITPHKILCKNALEFEKVAQENTWFVKNQIHKVLTTLKWQHPLLWIYDLSAAPLISQLGECGVIYDCVDNFSAFSWSDPNTEKWETALLARANVVMTSASTLFEERLSRNNNTYLVPNAADFEHFSRGSNFSGVEPAELKNIPHPRLAFIGAVYEWLDFKLLSDLATGHPEWNIVIIGPQQHNLELPQSNNLYWLGARDYKLLPFYIQGFDIMLIPFLNNEITRHANPIKLWEYLAAGKPVVATRLPEIPELPEVIWQSDDYQSFQKNCMAALDIIKNSQKKNEITQKAQNFAKNNSWDDRCKTIRMILKKHFDM